MNALSNYPCGVTGNEYEIAGGEAQTVNRECKGTGYVVDFDDPDLVTESDCPFSGEVDAEAYNYELFWTCPTCGYENVESWGGPEEFDDPEKYEDYYDDGYDTDYY